MTREWLTFAILMFYRDGIGFTGNRSNVGNLFDMRGAIGIWFEDTMGKRRGEIFIEN